MFVTLGPRPIAGRRSRAIATALLVAGSVFTAGCTATGNTSVPVELPRDRYEYSADGVTWGGAEQIPWDRETIPVPGGDPNATTFHLRVSGEPDVTAEVYLGNWSVDRGAAWFRVDVDGAPGERVTLPGPTATGPGVLMNEFPIDAGGSVELTLNVGVPYAETEQSVRIDPDWGIVLRETGGGGGGTGSIGSGSLGSGGSSAGSSAGSSGQIGSSVSGSSGSAGSSAGSTLTFGSLGGPLVPGS